MNTSLMNVTMGEISNQNGQVINSMARNFAETYTSTHELTKENINDYVKGLGEGLGNIDVCTDNLKKNTVLYILHNMVEASVEENGKVKPMFKSKEIAEAFEKAGLYSAGYINNLLGINKNESLFGMFLAGWNIGVLAELRKVANAKDKDLMECVALLDKDAKDKDNIKKINEFMGKKDDEVIEQELDIVDIAFKIQNALQQIQDLQLMIMVWGAEIMAEGFDA